MTILHVTCLFLLKDGGFYFPKKGKLVPVINPISCPVFKTEGYVL